jgi:hypothetical protein
MKNQKWILSSLLAIGFFATVFVGCKKDEPAAFNLTALTADGVDLNGSSSATGVASNAPIIATFSTAVDAATATTTTITLTNDLNSTPVTITVTTSGDVVTITPGGALDDGSLYKLAFTAGLKSTGGVAFTPLERTFTTAGFFAPAGYVASFNFEGDATDATGNYNAVSSTGITYVAGRNADAGQAASFDGSTSIIQIPNAAALENGPAITLAFWVYGDTLGHTNAGGGLKGNFVMGAGFFHGIEVEADARWQWMKMGASYISGSDTTAPDFFVNGVLDPLPPPVIVYEVPVDIRAQMAEKWAHVVITFDAATGLHSLYLNGVLLETDNNNLSTDPIVQGVTALVFNANAGVGSQFAFGFATDPASTFWADTDFGDYAKPDANHFKGMLDDVKIYHKALTGDEILAMYNSSK